MISSVKTWIIFAIAVAIVAGCGPKPQKGEKIETRITPTFDYVPPSSTSTDTVDISFCLVNPKFPEDWKDYLSYYPYDKFLKNMPLDFEEILSAKGFRMRGPFRTYDEMTFPDKSESDLVLMPNIEISVQPVGAVKASMPFMADYYVYEWNGQVNLSGRVSINLNETLTNERMWTKSVELPAKSFKYKSPKYREQIEKPQISDTDFGNQLAIQLQEYYTTTMDQVWKYLDPHEMQMVKKQAQDLKEKKRY